MTCCTWEGSACLLVRQMLMGRTSPWPAVNEKATLALAWQAGRDDVYVPNLKENTPHSKQNPDTALEGPFCGCGDPCSTCVCMYCIHDHLSCPTVTALILYVSLRVSALPIPFAVKVACVVCIAMTCLKPSPINRILNLGNDTDFLCKDRVLRIQSTTGADMTLHPKLDSAVC